MKQETKKEQSNRLINLYNTDRESWIKEMVYLNNIKNHD